MKSSLIKILFSAFIISILFVNDANAQCPMCKAAVESSIDSGQSNAGRGLNNGILYLLAAPYLFVAALGVVWYKRYRVKAKTEMKDETIIMN